MSFRFPAGSKKTLEALSIVCGEPQWRVLVNSVDCYLRGLPHHERAKVDRLTRT